MVRKVFVLGLPGSGKSTAIRLLDMFARDHRWAFTCLNDYDILYEMFLQDTRGQFSPSRYDGFDVRDVSVYDTALLELQQKAYDLEQTRSYKLIFIEFSRNDYCQALRLFTAPFLQNAFFLFIRASIAVCKYRVQERVKHRQGEEDRDNHFFSEYIFDEYYQQDNGEYPILRLNSQQDRNGQRYEISEANVQIVDNTTATPKEFEVSLGAAWRKIEQMVEFDCMLSTPAP